MWKREILVFWIVLCVQHLCGQTDAPERDFYRMVGAHLNAGSIFAHSADVENTAGSVPFGIELEFSKRQLGENAWKTCHCYPTSGFVLGYTNYDNAVLGHGFHVTYFLEHTFLPFKKWSPVLRGAGGLSASTRPYHPEKNPDNESYSLPINAFLQLQFGVDFSIGNSGLVSVKAGYNHISNGGIKDPNKGVNWPHLTAGYLHRINYFPPPQREKTSISDLESRWIKRIELFGAYTSGEREREEPLFAYGSMLTVARKLSALQTLSLAGEWHFHQEHRRRIESSDSQASAHRAALLVGHDFLFGKMVFTQQIGVYVFDQFQYHDPIYHRWGIAYVHEKGMSFGISLKAHRHVAEFVDIRVGWHW